MPVLTVLGSGYSSLGGIFWYLVGRDHELAFWVVRQDWSEAQDPSGYEVRRFVADKPFENCPTASDAEITDLIEFAGGQEPRGDLNWNDASRARDLFSEYKRARTGIGEDSR